MSLTHEHSHDHPPGNTIDRLNAAFIIAILSNAIFVVIQIIYAYKANSTSLLADAMHNLGDVLSLVLSWVANILMKRVPTARSTYGLKKISILAALINGLLMVFTCGVIATEAMYKFFSPAEMQTTSVMVVASIGIIVNGATAALFVKYQDLNVRSAFIHLFADALVSLGVVIAAAFIMLTGWLWLDPLMGLFIALVILRGTWGLFKDSFRLIIDGVPRGISIQNVKELLLQQEGVEGVHDLHVWALSTQQNALSAHLWMPENPITDDARKKLEERLRKEFSIHHITIQVERSQEHCHDVCISYL
ncbi:cation efflux system protein [Legionella adelaidensis]|uniref:Cation efflux system protein n=1 Tax=Legionella adelaidensis TaxID=45056 RepID=A0A0W0R638_9GAMM|nr:cation efflux system protein [Legionella adelaidensis]